MTSVANISVLKRCHMVGCTITIEYYIILFL